MGDAKLTQLDAVTAIDSTDLCYLVNDVAGTPTSKKIATVNLLKYAPRNGLVVAAADSPAIMQEAADYVCDGTADEVQIQAAIDALPTTGNVTVKVTGEANENIQGGTVYLCPGSYQIADEIDLSGKSNITLQGSGPGTVIYNTATDASPAIYTLNADGSPKNRICIRDMIIQGNASSGPGIYSKGVNYDHYFNLHLLFNGGHGMHLEAYSGGVGSDGPENKVIQGCQCQFNGGSGLYMKLVHETMINGCHFEENDAAGIYLDATINTHIGECSVEDNYGTNQLEAINSCSKMHIGDTILAGVVAIDATADLFLTGVDVTTSMTITGDADVFMTGCQVNAMGAVTAGNFQMTGCRVNWATCNITISSSLTWTGNYIQFGSDDTVILYNAANVQVTISANSLNGGDLLIDGNGQTNARVTYSANNVRGPDLTFDDLWMASISGNCIMGGGSVTLSNFNAGGACAFVGNAFENSCTTTFAATVACSGIISGNAWKDCVVTNSGSMTMGADNVDV